MLAHLIAKGEGDAFIVRAACVDLLHDEGAAELACRYTVDDPSEHVRQRRVVARLKVGTLAEGLREVGDDESPRRPRLRVLRAAGP